MTRFSLVIFFHFSSFFIVSIIAMTTYTKNYLQSIYIFGKGRDNNLRWFFSCVKGPNDICFALKRAGSIGTTKSHALFFWKVRPASPLLLCGMLSHSRWATALNLQFGMLFDDFRFFLTQKCTKNMIKRLTLAADIMMIGRSHSLPFPVDWKASLKRTKKDHFLWHESGAHY